MKITKAVVFVAVDDSLEARQLFITKDMTKVLIAMVEVGAFHKDAVTISEKVSDTIVFTKDEK